MPPQTPLGQHCWFHITPCRHSQYCEEWRPTLTVERAETHSCIWGSAEGTVLVTLVGGRAVGFLGVWLLIFREYGIFFFFYFLEGKNSTKFVLAKFTATFKIGSLRVLSIAHRFYQTQVPLSIQAMLTNCNWCSLSQRYRLRREPRQYRSLRYSPR